MTRFERAPSAAPARLACFTVGTGLALALAACGGGGGAGPEARSVGAGEAIVSSAVVFSGTVANGSPMVGATVRVLDASGQEVGRSQPVGDDGRYRVELAGAAAAPFALLAELPGSVPQVSVFGRAESSTVNVTPITSLIAARLSSNGMPDGLERNFKREGGAQPPSAAEIGSRTSEILSLIAPVAQALGDTTNPVTGNFSVGGAGHDRLLDSITVTITPNSSTAANIELTVKARNSEDAPMPTVAFSSAARSLPVVPAVDRRDLPVDGTAARIERLMAMMNACYALPVEQRVRSAGTIAAEVLAGPCRDMFWQGNPANYLNGGSRVTSSGSFVGIFTGFRMVFERPVFEYRRPGSDDVVFSGRGVDLQGNVTQHVFFARAEGDALRLVGDQYRHPMAVLPYVEWGTFLLPGSIDHDFVTTGYSLNVPNVLTANGTPVYDRVEVVAPVGLEGGATRDRFVLRPLSGRTSLRLADQWGSNGSTQVVRMAGEFVDARATTPVHPKEVTSSGAVWVNGSPWTDERVERLSQKAVWTFRYFLAGNTGSQPDAEQHLTTQSRAPSIREARQTPVATLTAQSTEFIRERSLNTLAPNIFWFEALPGGGSGRLPAGDLPPPFQIAWNVPAGGVPPTTLFIAGRGTTSYALPFSQRLDFDLSPTVLSTARSATVACPKDWRSATLCDPVDPARFSRMTMVNSINLNATNGSGVRITRAHFPNRPAVRPIDPPQP